MITMRFLVLSTLILWTAAWPHFKTVVPNGDKVPHPCNRSLTWVAVGHSLPNSQQVAPPFPLLQFGIDFKAANNSWTEELCRLDSDGDGKTNGEELGDPDCTWSEGQEPAVTNTSELSHPDFCEPLDNPKCMTFKQNRLLSEFPECKSQTGVSWCPRIEAPFTNSMSMQLDKVTLPTKDHFYMCKEIDVPSDSNYHIIAWEANVESKDVQSAILFACDFPDEEAYLATYNYKKGRECPSTPPCTSATLMWSKGNSPRCLDTEVGVPMGKDFYRKMILQVHYHNPENKTDLKDSSGFKVHYSPVVRPNEKGVIALGQMDLAIPPNKKDAIVIGPGFNKNCSESQLEPYSNYSIMSVLFQTRQAGKYVKLSLIKNSTSSRIVLAEGQTSLERPKYVEWSVLERPVLAPGDSFEVECHFDTSDRSKWTFWGGQSNFDEKCLVYVEVYPRPKNRMFLMAANLGDIDNCQYRSNQIGNCSKNSIAGILQNTEKPTSRHSLTASCGCPEAYPVKSCSSRCYSFLKRSGLLTNPCIKGMAFHSIARNWLSAEPEDIYTIQSQTEMCIALGTNSAPANGTKCTDGAEHQTSSALITAPASQTSLVAILALILVF